MSSLGVKRAKGCKALALEEKIESQMNWFQRHLNWTVVLAAVVGGWIAFGAGFSFEALYSGVPDEAFFAILFIPLAIIFPVAGWALKQKGRSLGWLGIFFVPFGWIFFLCLENRKTKAESHRPEPPEGELPAWGSSAAKEKMGIKSESDADSQIDDTLKARQKMIDKATTTKTVESPQVKNSKELREEKSTPTT